MQQGSRHFATIFSASTTNFCERSHLISAAISVAYEKYQTARETKA